MDGSNDDDELEELENMLREVEQASQTKPASNNVAAAVTSLEEMDEQTLAELESELEMP